ncbi:MAG TPA: CoA transferase [Thermomicrobiales bacterium]|nr:CoA transferase [Thermomicrobiales bacterium]
MTETRGPLDGVRVLDLSRVLAGPYCTMMLGDLGADVLKIEQPGRGDDTRAWGPPWVGTESAYYVSVNRNKRSMTLDLKLPAAQQIIRELAAQSDIVVENFRRGSLERMHIGHEQLSEPNPRLIWSTISGYGSDGPDADRPGYDFVTQGESGIMAITGEPDGEPMKVGVAIVDITTSLFTTIAILGALRSRDATGRGQRVDTNLLSSAVAWLANVGQSHLVSGQPARRYRNAHASIVPYQAFRARDQHFTVAVGNDRQFSALCHAIGRPDIAHDPRFVANPLRVENRDALVALLHEVFETREARHWLDACQAAGVPSGPINSIEQVFQHPQVLANGMLAEIDHPLAGTLRMAGIPYTLSGSPASVRMPPPLLGQHTEEVLKERLGRTDQDIAKLRRDGVI